MLNASYNRQQYFCNFSWRKLLNEVCKEIDLDNIGLQIISPFGFELFEKKIFLHKNLKRLYCYIGIPANNIFGEINLLKLSQDFSIKLMSLLNRINISTNDIAILVTQDKFFLKHSKNYKCKSSDKLIDIQVRVVDEDILTDYGKYIICTIDGMLSKKDEPGHFYKNKRHRCRTYQLYLMLEQIFGYLLPSLTVFQKEKMSRLFSLIDNSIQMFYDPSEISIRANDFDMHILNTLIVPRVTLISERIKNFDQVNKLMVIKSDSYHVPGQLEIAINEAIYSNAINKIKRTYLNFI